MQDLLFCKKFLLALEFASIKHERQKRKGFYKRPYINHPILVVTILVKNGEYDVDLLTAAILHDVVEDTTVTHDEIREMFGETVLKIVLEVSDDMSLSHKKRKELQILKASGLSDNAKKIKIADKTANISDLLEYPLYWNKKRKLAYVLWSKEVIDKCRTINSQLEELFDITYKKAIQNIH